MRFEAVAFDLDGTLYPDSRLYRCALPYVLSRAKEFSAFGQARRHMRLLGLGLAGEGGEKPKDGSEFRLAQAAFVAERLRLPNGEAAIPLVESSFYRGVEELFARVRPYEGVAAALDELARSGLRLALLSDLPPGRKLELMGLAGRFELALCSEASGALKPAREPFAMLAEALGLPPGRILYVGNVAKIDVAGAKEAGMATAIISRKPAPGADLRFRDWRKLVRFATA